MKKVEIDGVVYVRIHRPYIEDCIAADGRYTDCYIRLDEHSPEWYEGNQEAVEYVGKKLR